MRAAMFFAALALACCLQSGCGTRRVNNALETLVDVGSWQPTQGGSPKRPVKNAIAYCYVEYVDGRVRDGFSSDMILTAYQGCMTENGYSQVVAIPPPPR